MPALDNESFRRLLLIDPREAIKNLHINYYDSLLRLSTRYTKDSDASQDILQETFKQIWERREFLSNAHETHIEFYLVRVVKVKSMRYYRDSLKERQDRETYLQQVRGTIARSNVEDVLLRRESHTRLRDIIKTFPRREKECLLLTIDEELSPEEIAQRLNVNRKAVYRSLESGYKRLRKIMSRDTI
jgi:RNA polymerase sigma factor (sigma-70 family)